MSDPRYGGHSLIELRAWIDYAARHERTALAVPRVTLQALLDELVAAQAREPAAAAARQQRDTLYLALSTVIVAATIPPGTIVNTEVWREALIDAIDTARRFLAVVPCPVCGQTPAGQTGEYPCELCGLPRLHDETPDAAA